MVNKFLAVVQEVGCSSRLHRQDNKKGRAQHDPGSRCQEVVGVNNWHLVKLVSSTFGLRESWFVVKHGLFVYTGAEIRKLKGAEINHGGYRLCKSPQVLGYGGAGVWGCGGLWGCGDMGYVDWGYGVRGLDWALWTIHPWASLGYPPGWLLVTCCGRLTQRHIRSRGGAAMRRSLDSDHAHREILEVRVCQVVRRA